MPTLSFPITFVVQSDGSYTATGGSGGSPAAFQWSTTDKDSQVAVTSSNHVATHSGSDKDAGVRGATSKSSGQLHFEVIATTVKTRYPGSCAVGLANASAGLGGSSWLGIDNNAIMWWDDGSVITNNTTVATAASYTSGDRLVLEPDLGAKSFKLKNATTNSSVTTVSFSAMSGPFFPACSVYAGSDAFTAADSTQAISSGYSVWS